MADFTLVICTYRRAKPLASALASVIALDVPDGLDFAVVVVDNSDDGSARPVVEAARAESPFPIGFVEAHPPNISVARNAGVAAAAGSSVVAFVDDDEQVERGWLRAATEGLASFDHDVFFGRVEPVFADPDRATPAIRNLYSREVRGGSGADLFAMGSRKTPGVTLGTNNSIFRRRAFEGGAAFDPAFGDAGGEDFDLFCRLQAKGLRFGWLPSAKVFEDVPAARCDEAYLRRRLYAGGQAYAAAVAGASDAPGATRWRIRLKAAAQAALLAPIGLTLPMRGRDARADYGFRLAGVLGKLSFGGLYPVYREGDPKPAG